MPESESVPEPILTSEPPEPPPLRQLLPSAAVADRAADCGIEIVAAHDQLVSPEIEIAGTLN